MNDPRPYLVNADMFGFIRTTKEEIFMDFLETQKAKKNSEKQNINIFGVLIFVNKTRMHKESKRNPLQGEGTLTLLTISEVQMEGAKEDLGGGWLREKGQRE